MNIFSAIRGWFGRGPATTDAKGDLSGQPGAPIVENSVGASIDSAMQVSAVYRAVELISKTVASLPLMVYDDNQVRKVARSTVLYEVLHSRPNPRMTPMNLWLALLLNLMLRGTAYARVDRNAQGEVIALWPMASDQVQTRILADGTLVYEYHVDGAVAILAEQSVMRIADMGGGTVGMSRLDFMRGTLTEAVNAQNHSSKTFAKSGKASGVLMIDHVLTKEQRAQLKENFAALQDSTLGRLVVLEAQMKYQQVSMTPEDAQLLESRQFQVADIGRWFGVPSILLNQADTTAWGSGIEQILDGFYKLTIRPLLVLIEQSVRMQVLTPGQRARYVVEFNFEGLLRAIAKDRYEIYAKAVQNGLKTRNEIRQLENDPPIAGGDDLTAQTNLAPLSMLGKVQANGKTPQDPIAQ